MCETASLNEIVGKMLILAILEMSAKMSGICKPKAKEAEHRIIRCFLMKFVLLIWIPLCIYSGTEQLSKWTI